MNDSNSFRPLISSYQRLIEFDSSHQFRFIVSFSNSDNFDSKDNIVLTTTVSVARVLSRKVNDLYQIDPTISEHYLNIEISKYPIKSLEKLQKDAIQNVFQLMLQSLTQPITINRSNFFPYLLLFDSLGNLESDREFTLADFKSRLDSIDEAKCLLSTSFRSESIDFLSDHLIELLKSDTSDDNDNNNDNDIDEETMCEIIDAYMEKGDPEDDERRIEVFKLLSEAGARGVLMHFLLRVDLEALNEEMVKYIIENLDLEVVKENASIMVKHLKRFYSNFGTTKLKFEFAFTGGLQTFTVPKDGEYVIKAVGASGSGGNTYGTNYTSFGGKGAEIEGKFELKKGEVIDIVVGGQGKMVQASQKEGASGGGGGGTFVFRRIANITNGMYQFSKKGVNYEALLVAAGGNGGEECPHYGRNSIGLNGEAANFKSPSNFTAYSTEKQDPNASGESAVLGITQFIEYDAKGGHYTRGNGHSYGGYGCGGSAYNNYSRGGGWCLGTNNQSMSWSLDAKAVGRDGTNSGDGNATIFKK